jgi:hypothetical protein
MMLGACQRGQSIFGARLMLLRTLVTLSFAFMLASCVHTKKPEPAPEPIKLAPPLWNWDEDAVKKATGPFCIKVALDEQKAKLYMGKTKVGWSYVATGVRKHPTPTGQHYVIERVSLKNSNLYGWIYNADDKVINDDAKFGRDPIPKGGRFEGSTLRYWMRITYGGVGMHVGIIPNPGSPASHGCVRLPAAAAKKIYEYAVAGTSVLIVESDNGKPPPSARKSAASLAAKPDPKPSDIAPAPVAPADPNAPPVPAAPAPAIREPTEPGGSAPKI